MNAKQEWLRNDLEEGEIYAGLILGEKGEADYHLIAMTPHKDQQMTWGKAIATETAGAALPNRREARLLFVNAREHFEQDLYWTGERYADNVDYIWCQNFRHGSQNYCHKKLYGRVVLVRRVPI